MITEAEVKETFDKFVEGLKKGDLDPLERLYDDDYLLVRPDGQMLVKRKILDDRR